MELLGVGFIVTEEVGTLAQMSEASSEMVARDVMRWERRWRVEEGECRWVSILSLCATMAS